MVDQLMDDQISEFKEAFSNFCNDGGDGINVINDDEFIAPDIVSEDIINSNAITVEEILEAVGGKGSSQLTIVSSSKVLNSPVSLVQGQRKAHKEKRLEQHKTELQVSQATILTFAIFATTLSFAGIFNPPGGVHRGKQGDPLRGKATLCDTTAYKVYKLSNTITLFLSVGVILVLASIIPCRNKAKEKLVALAYKVMLIVVSFMLVEYIAASWAITKHGEEVTWNLECLITLAGGLFVAIFLGLGVMLARCCVRERKWRKMKEKKGKATDSNIITQDERPVSEVSTLYTRDMKVCLM